MLDRHLTLENIHLSKLSRDSVLAKNSEPYRTLDKIFSDKAISFKRYKVLIAGKANWVLGTKKGITTFHHKTETPLFGMSGVNRLNLDVLNGAYLTVVEKGKQTLYYQVLGSFVNELTYAQWVQGSTLSAESAPTLPTREHVNSELLHG